MRILYLLHPAFQFSGARQSFDEWIQAFFIALESLGMSPHRFNPWKDRLENFDLIHLFSWRDAETWEVLIKFQIPRVVTPSFQAPPDTKNESYPFGWKVARALHQRSWPPVDRNTFYSSADHYLIRDEQWIDYLHQHSGISRDRISLMTAPPVEAARLASTCYQKARQP